MTDASASEVGACWPAMVQPNTGVTRNRLPAGSYLLNPQSEARA